MRSRLMWTALLTAAVLAAGSGDLRAGQPTGVKTPRKIKDVKPVYPARSLTAGDEGVVVIELRVDAFGLVTDAHVLWSKCPALNEPALKAVRGWQYERVLVNGEAAPYGITTEVPFRLPEKLKARGGQPGACRWVDPPKPIL